MRAGVAPANVDRDDRVDRRGDAASWRAKASTASELADCKRYLVGSMPRQLETNGGIASFLQSAEFFGLGLDLDRRLPALLDAVTLDEVHAATAARARSGRARRSSVAGPIRHDQTAAVFFDVDFTLIYPGPDVSGRRLRGVLRAAWHRASMRRVSKR